MVRTYAQSVVWRPLLAFSTLATHRDECMASEVARASCTYALPLASFADGVAWRQCPEVGAADLDTRRAASVHADISGRPCYPPVVGKLSRDVMSTWVQNAYSVGEGASWASLQHLAGAHLLLASDTHTPPMFRGLGSGRPVWLEKGARLPTKPSHSMGPRRLVSLGVASASTRTRPCGRRPREGARADLGIGRVHSRLAGRNRVSRRTICCAVCGRLPAECGVSPRRTRAAAEHWASCEVVQAARTSLDPDACPELRRSSAWWSRSSQGQREMSVRVRWQRLAAPQMERCSPDPLCSDSALRATRL